MFCLRPRLGRHTEASSWVFETRESAVRPSLLGRVAGRLLANLECRPSVLLRERCNPPRNVKFYLSRVSSAPPEHRKRRTEHSKALRLHARSRNSPWRARRRRRTVSFGYGFELMSSTARGIERSFTWESAERAKSTRSRPSRRRTGRRRMRSACTLELPPPAVVSHPNDFAAPDPGPPHKTYAHWTDVSRREYMLEDNDWLWLALYVHRESGGTLSTPARAALDPGAEIGPNERGASVKPICMRREKARKKIMLNVTGVPRGIARIPAPTPGTAGSRRVRLSGL